MRSKFTKLVVGAIAAAGVAISGAAHAQKVNWSMATPWGGGKPYEDAKSFAAMVKDLTEGRVNITTFPAGTLGKALKVTDSVKSCVAHLATTGWAMTGVSTQGCSTLTT